MSLEHRPNQRERLLALLESRAGAWVTLPEILDLGIAQYNARIFELRRMGHAIENRTEEINGVRHSWFRLVKPAAAERGVVSKEPWGLTA